jgi:YggT family protein
MFVTIYEWIRLGVLTALCLFILALLTRMILSYVDPNPFSRIGRMGFKLRKRTEPVVYPAAGVLARFGVDIKLAPLITILVALLATYFSLQMLWNILAMIQGVTVSAQRGDALRIVGHLLFGALAIYSLLIIVSIFATWILEHGHPVMRFLRRITEPVLAPFRRLIPPVGMFDISPLIVMLLLGFIQMIVSSTFGLH